MRRAITPLICALAASALALAAALPSLANDQQARPFLTLTQLREKYSDQAGRIASIGGVDVYYKDEGRGDAILMVHGSVSTLRTWDKIASRLKSRYRIIRYDIPPQGLSGPVSDAAAAKLAPADMAEALLDRLKVRRVTVVGVSSGGTLGVALAAKRPDLVQRLIISNAPSDPVTTDHQVLSPAFEAAIEEQRRAKFSSMKFWDAFLDFYAGDPKRISARTRSEYYDMNRRAPEPNQIALVAQVANHERAVAVMAAVRAPTLLIWGGSDALLPPAAADKLASYLKQSEVSKVILPDVGHYPPLEAPERYTQLIQAYMEAATPNVAPPQ